MRPIPSVSLAVVTVLGALATAGAQPNVAGRELVGLVRDSTGTAVEDAIVEISGVLARTDARGTFRLYTSNVDTVTIAIRRLGFSPVSALLTARDRKWDTVVVEMDRVAQRLAKVSVKAATALARLGLKDLEERRTKGLGQFVSREEIAARNTNRPSDVLRDKRGVRVVRIRSGGHGVRFAAFTSSRPNCAPSIWVDGQLVPDMELDEITANDIEAIELYESWTSTPMEFSKGTEPPCGTIVVWTRVPGA